MKFYGLTDIGKKRRNNQDNFSVEFITASIALAVVCDGMGGANGGGEASRLAVISFMDCIHASQAKFLDDKGSIKPEQLEKALIDAVKKANSVIYKKSVSDPNLAGMGTTLVACIIENNRMWAVNVGDSSLYSINNKGGVKISKDHSLVQALVDEGSITAEEAVNHPNRNIILRALGIESSVEADLYRSELDGGYIMLCSDGLSNYITDYEFKQLLNDGTTEEKVHRLIAFANESGGSDNITAVLINLEE